MAGIPAISGFSVPAVGGIPSGVVAPVGSYKIPAGLALGAGGSPGASGAAQASAAQAPGYGPSDITNAGIHAYEIQSPFDPMMLFDLMNMGVTPFQSPFSGSGLAGFAPAVSGSRVMSAPALSGQLAGAAPVPQSGGKGIVG